MTTSKREKELLDRVTARQEANRAKIELGAALKSLKTADEKARLISERIESGEAWEEDAGELAKLRAVRPGRLRHIEWLKRRAKG